MGSACAVPDVGFVTVRSSREAGLGGTFGDERNVGVNERGGVVGVDNEPGRGGRSGEIVEGSTVSLLGSRSNKTGIVDF
jgi:hypothetical protein